MQQRDFFYHLDFLYDQLSKSGDPLEWMDKRIAWKRFGKPLSKVRRAEARKGNAGRPPFDELLMFKILVWQSLYNLGDDATEYQIKDRLSFRRFLGLSLTDKVPDAKTIWLFRENLVNLKVIDKLFATFDKCLNEAGFAARRGQIVDASFVETPKQRNNREDNETIKAGGIPESFKEVPAKLRQKDLDARWTKKNEQAYYGYKNHINIDRDCKLIRKYEVTDASVHDSRVLEKLIDPDNTNADTYADSAYRSQETEAALKEAGYRSKVHFKAGRNKPLTQQQQNANKLRGKVRARVEHVFGHQANSMKAGFIRTIGLARATFKIGMTNLVYNMQRFIQLQRIYRITPS